MKYILYIKWKKLENTKKKERERKKTKIIWTDLLKSEQAKTLFIRWNKDENSHLCVFHVFEIYLFVSTMYIEEQESNQFRLINSY